MFENVSDLDRTVRVMNAAHGAALESVAELDERRVWEADGSTCVSAWLAGQFGLTRSTASEWVRVARSLRTLPHIARAYREGRLSWDQVRPLTRFADPDTDERWAALYQLKSKLN